MTNSRADLDGSTGQGRALQALADWRDQPVDPMDLEGDLQGDLKVDDDAAHP
jgi:hypothetical protein